MDIIKDAHRFQFLQNIDPKDAQAFFWNFTSRRERAKAIDRAMQSKDIQDDLLREVNNPSNGLGGD